jgi:Ca2+-binding RTX toxin-like protein
MAVITGTDQSDIIYGTEESDVVYALGGNEDRVYSLGGNDTIIGGGGRDLIIGNYGDDYLVGGAGNDDLDGAQGNDTLIGNRGNNSFVLWTSQGDYDVIVCRAARYFTEIGGFTSGDTTTGFEPAFDKIIMRLDPGQNMVLELNARNHTDIKVFDPTGLVKRFYIYNVLPELFNSQNLQIEYVN